MPRIALFAPYLPAPAFTGGRIRIHHFANALAALGPVELFAQAGPREAFAARHASELGVYAHWQTAVQWLPALPGGDMPMRTHRGSPRGLLRAFQRAHASARFDVVVAEHSHAARWAPQLGLPWVLDEHNVESRYLAAKLGARAQGNREIERLARWEHSLWRSANEVVCVTESDATEIAAVRGRAPVLIPNGVDTSAITFVPPSQRTGMEILFVGLMDHPPNVRAARWLATQVMPAVWREAADARLVLCGANPNREVLSLAGPRVTVTGRVDSVAPYLARARSCACPLFEGAGSSLKVLEALASGVPLVATETAVRGFDLHDDTHYHNAQDPAGFATQLLRTLREPGDDSIAQRGRELAQQHDFGQLARQFAELVARVAQA